MKLDEIREFISEEFNIYAFGVGSFHGEVVNLSVYGVKEPDTAKLVEYLKEKGIKYSYEQSSNKLEKTFIFTIGGQIKTRHYLEDGKLKQKLYVSI